MNLASLITWSGQQKSSSISVINLCKSELYAAQVYNIYAENIAYLSKHMETTLEERPSYKVIRENMSIRYINDLLWIKVQRYE